MLAVLLLLALAPATVPGPSQAQAAAVADEFVEPLDMSAFASSVVRVNAREATDPENMWRGTAPGVVVAPGRVVTFGDVVDRWSGLVDGRFTVVDGKANRTATLLARDQESGLALLDVTDLQAPAAVLADDLPRRDEAATVSGYQFYYETTDFNGAVYRIEGVRVDGRMLSANGDFLTAGAALPTLFGGGGLADQCGRLIGLVRNSNVATTESGGVSAAAIQRLLRNASVTPTVSTGWCADAELRTRVRAHRASLAQQDAEAVKAWKADLKATTNGRNLNTALAIGIGGLLLVGGLVGVYRAREETQQPRRIGKWLLFAGFGVAGFGIGADPLLTLIRGETPPKLVTCTLQPGATLRSANPTEEFYFRPAKQCRTLGTSGEGAYYLVNARDGANGGYEYSRLVRPRGTTIERGAPVIVEAYEVSSDLKRLDIARYQLPAAVFDQADPVYRRDIRKLTCDTPDIADRALKDRRALSAAYFDDPQIPAPAKANYLCTVKPGRGG